MSQVERVALLPSLFRGAVRAASARLRGPGFVAVTVIASAFLLRPAVDRVLPGPAAGDYLVRRVTLEPEVPVAGTLRAVRADSYGAPVVGVELKLTWLAEEGSLVAAGDRLAQFDPAPFQKDLDLARARARELAGEADQARLGIDALRLKSSGALQEKRGIAELSERDLSTLVNTTAPLSARESAHEVEQRQRMLEDTEAKLAGLEPFIAQGFISQEEYRAAVTRRDQAAADLKLARARHSALVQQTNPDRIRHKIEETEAARRELLLNTTRSQVEQGQAEAAARVAAARLEEAQRQIGEAERRIAGCTVLARSPGLVVHSEIFDRTGDRRKVRVGDAIWGGTTIITLPDLSEMVVDARVPESEIHRLTPGRPVRVRLDAFPDHASSGTLRSIGSVGASERNESRSFPVVIALAASDARLRPGMVARCAIQCEPARRVVAVPVDAIRIDGKSPYVLVASRWGKITRREVVLGAATSQLVEVRRGVAAGEIVRIRGSEE